MSLDATLSPPPNGFSEIWHAQVLAMADELINARIFGAEDWAQSLGAALQAAEAREDPDTEDTYFNCALTALEGLCRDNGGLSPDALSMRKSAWERAYSTTAYGEPVVLPNDEFTQNER